MILFEHKKYLKLIDCLKQNQYIVGYKRFRRAFVADSPRLYESHVRRVSMRLRAGQGAPNASTSDLSNSKQAKWVAL